jgi:hypothetical protein
MIKLGDAALRTSSYTVGNACVEIGSDAPSRVNVTDSKFNHTAEGRSVKPVLSVSPGAFSALIEHVRV